MNTLSRKVVRVQSSYNFNELLRKLVGIDSVNPAYGGCGEQNISQFVSAYIENLGLSPVVQSVFPGRENIIAKIGQKDRPSILLEAHMDTVSVSGWKTGDPFDLIDKDGRLWGRGACDTKSSLTVFLKVLSYFAEHPEELKFGLVFAASVDEESKQQGAIILAETLADLNVIAAITGEPTLSDIVYAHKGACHYKVKCSGNAVHGSTPELGENAIYRATRLINKLEEIALNLGESGPSIENGSLNVGLISGGSGFNIVPDRCTFEIDRRVGIKETIESARSSLVEIIKRAAGCEFECVLERSALNTSMDHWFPQDLLKAANAIDHPVSLRAVGYMTNAVAYADSGIPSLVFGPGDIAQAHKCDEFIVKGEMEKSFEILKRFLSKSE